MQCSCRGEGLRVSLCSGPVDLGPWAGLITPGCSPSRFEGRRSSLRSCLAVSPSYPGILRSNLETPFIRKSIESAIWQRPWGFFFFAVPRDCAGSSSARLGPAAPGLPLLCAASSVGAGFWALTTLPGETFLSHRPFQFPHRLFLDPVIGIPLPRELALEPDSFPRPPRGKRGERLKSWGTAADVLPQNRNRQRLVSSWPVPKISGPGSRTFSSPSAWFGCWKGLFVAHEAAMYLAGASR